MDALDHIFNEIEKEFDQRIMPRAKKFLDAQVSTWVHKPIWKIDKSRIGGTLSRYIYPSGDNAQQFVWVSRGTADHGDRSGSGYKIVARNAPNLIYNQFYDPKTLPGGRFGGTGEEYGGIVRRKQVTHWGIKPRHIEEYVMGQLDAWNWRSKIENAIRRGLRKAAKQQQPQTAEV